VFHTERVRIAVSVGVAMWEPGMTLDTVVDAADGLMYAAKELGGSSIATTGPDGRRLLGLDDDDDRDLDVVLSGAIQVTVAPVSDRDGHVRGLRAMLSAEIRHPSVEDLTELLIRGVRPHLEDSAGGERLTLIVGPSGLLWATDGLVLRLLVALSAALPAVRLQLVVAPEDGHDATIRQAILIRDALDIGLVVGRFGSPGGGDLRLVDRIAPVALELEDGVIAPGTDGPSSAQVAACALATSHDLVVLVPRSPEQQPAEVYAMLDASCSAERCALLVDLGAMTEHRREPQPSASATGREGGRR
jgi:hypothetical protein